ncbi:Erg28 like protein-domain-containing protein [Blyttiomyces helicus]|uniref:Erg28 like protein-domain-containing protein n=1 Tax=Blyttiomyces helicus TaxID=388810 RepID=A0A4P9WGL5_9FUNG|nr:Erg28 like protein-domain-containing protein [Blyttiomyces helicus]|eukprot:RKO89626.1 Erg28 like protein-domain-containing protein [Blyttiomyces helicus]
MNSLGLTLPSGALPKYLLFIGALAFYNGVQCYVPKMRVTSRIYARQPAEATALMARMMGLWTMTSAMIRVYAALNISNPVAYQLGMWSYIFALFSFVTEVSVYKTAPLSSPGVFPALIIAPVSLFWMWSSYSHYVSP